MSLSPGIWYLLNFVFAAWVVIFVFTSCLSPKVIIFALCRPCPLNCEVCSISWVHCEVFTISSLSRGLWDLHAYSLFHRLWDLHMYRKKINLSKKYKLKHFFVFPPLSWCKNPNLLGLLYYNLHSEHAEQSQSKYAGIIMDSRVSKELKQVQVASSVLL